MMIKQQRTEPRINIQRCINIHNTLTEHSMGELVNLTAEGMMLISAQPIISNAVYQVELTLPSATAGATSITLGIECLWCQQTKGHQHYWSGHQIIDASPGAEQAIKHLIQREQHSDNTLTAS